MFKKLKEEWFKKKEVELYKAHQEELSYLTDTHKKQQDDLKRELEEVESAILRKKNELEYERELLEKMSSEFKKEAVHLKDQLKIVEQMAHPSLVWTEAFTLGFSKAWDMMIPVMMDGVSNVKKQIVDRAISETLERLSGNDS